MSNYKIIFLVLLLGFVWAGETALGKLYLLAGGTPTAFPALLNLGTVIILLGLSIANGNIHIFSLSIRQAWTIFLSSISLIFVPYLVIYRALIALTPAEIALMSALTPACTIVLNGIATRSWPSSRAFVAVLVGFLGVSLLLITNGGGKNETEYILWMTLMLIVPFSYAFSGFAIKMSTSQDVDYLKFTFFINLFSLILFFIADEKEIIITIQNFKAPLYVGAGITFNIFASFILLSLAKITSAINLSFSNYSTIFWASIVSSFLFSESIEMIFFISAFLIIFSVYLISTENRIKCMVS